MRTLSRLASILMVSGALPALATTVLYDFDDGTMQGWRTLSASTNPPYPALRFAPVTQAHQWSIAANNPGLGSYFLGETPESNDSLPVRWVQDPAHPSWLYWPAAGSGVHQTLWVESPAFVLDGSGDLTFMGCGSAGAPNPAHLPGWICDIPLTTIPLVAGNWGGDSGNPIGMEGNCAIGLRRDDGVFVLTRHVEDWGSSWRTYMFSASELAPYVNDGHRYTVDLVDCLAGTGAWIAIDNVRVPGKVMTPSPLQAPTIQVAAGSATNRVSLRWNPTIGGLTQTLVSSDSLDTPLTHWDVVQTVPTQDGATAVEIESTRSNAFFKVLSPSYVEDLSISEQLASVINYLSAPWSVTSFTMQANGEGLKYKWYKNGTLLVGETNRTLNLNVTSVGIYTGVVTGISGKSITNTATLSYANTDYHGHPFVTNTAPVLTFQRKTAPTLKGIDYAFPEQTAHGVALLSRFPPFTNSASRLHVDGPWYNNYSANLHFTRGITSIGAMPNYRLTDNEPTTLTKVAPEHKWQLMTDPLWYTFAENLANKLQQANPSDSRITALRNLSQGHVFTDDQSAYKALGYYAFQEGARALDINGKFVRYPCLDIETTGNWQHQRNCFGWIYQGLAQGANERGLSIIPMLYGQWQYSVGAFNDSMRQNGTGDPSYLLPEKDCLASPDPTLVACQQNNGILSMDGYLQAIWGMEPFYKRNADKSLVLVNGLPVFNDITSSTAYGCSLYMEPASQDQWGNPIATESKHCLDNLYRQAVRMYLQHHYRAGQYPANSSLKKSFLSNCKIGAWGRFTNEGMDNVNQNDRPIPGWLLDTLTAIYYFTADDITIWSSDMNFRPGPLGADYTATWSYNAHGVLEHIVRAAHRYSANDPLHASSATYQWCWFNLPVVNQNATAGDRYFEKPIAFGKLRPFEGHTYLELFIAWPALDDTAKTFKVWIDKDGVTKSKAYSVQVANGRTYFYDAWQLPDTFTGLQGKDIWLRTTDMLGVQRTWRGDYRVTATNTVPTPADF